MFKYYKVEQGAVTFSVCLETWHAKIEREQYEPATKTLATHELAYWQYGDERDIDHDVIEEQGTFLGVLDRNMGPFAVACLESVIECVQWYDMDHLILGGNRSGTIAYVE